jgi:hypothetical protein
MLRFSSLKENHLKLSEKRFVINLFKSEMAGVIRDVNNPVVFFDIKIGKFSK